MKAQKWIIVAGLLLAMALTVSACGGAAAPTTAPAQPTAAPAQPTAAPAQPTAAPAQPTAAPAQPTAAGAQPTVAGVAQAGANAPIKTPPLNVADHATMKGKSYQMAILGIGGWPPSSLSVQMANDLFTKYAKETYGYDVKFSFQESPFSSLFQKAAASLGTRSNEYNIIISDSQWLGALAEPGWIISADDIIKLEPSLDIEWYAPVIKTSYQVYPDGTGQRWGFPQETDVEVLYVRQDIFSDQKERDAFKAKYNRDLPQTYDDWAKEDFDSFKQIAEFFTRPDKQMYGTVMQYTKEYDFISMYLYPFWYSFGGDIWDPNTRNVYGILNKPENAKALEYNKEYLKFQPPGAINYGISEDADAFTTGKAVTAFQWAAMGPSMITDQLKGKVLVVQPPGAKKADGTIYRMYPMGGQPWVVNAFNTPEQQRIAIDYLKWWFQPETLLEYAKRGGNPSDKATLERPDFDSIQPWFKAMKAMLPQSRDFWHDPTYSALLAAQQEGWTAYASGQATDPVKVNEWIACQQQKILYDAGRTNTAPPASCANASYK